MSSSKPAHPLWRLTKTIAGLSLFVLGVVGLFLPIVQGVLFMLLGLAVLATENRHARHVVETLKRRYPGPWKQAERLRARLSRYVKTTSDKQSEDEASGDEGSSRETP